MLQLVFETHSLTVDNERGIATGWLPGELSAEGRRLARALGERRREDGIACVFTSDLRRAIETAMIAFEGMRIDVRHDARLRECNYGRLNGAPLESLGRRTDFIDNPFPDGESYRDCVSRTEDFLRDLVAEFHGRRVLVVGHTAQRWSFDHLLLGVALGQAVEPPFEWREGWEYTVTPGVHPAARSIDDA